MILFNTLSSTILLLQTIQQETDQMKNSYLSSVVLIAPLIIFLHIQRSANCFNKFCSVLCANQSCATNSSGDCTACADPWTFNVTTNKCQVTSTSLWVLISNSTDISGSMVPNSTATAFCNSTTTGQWSYRYNGNIIGKNMTKYTYNTGPTIPHYQVRVIFWMILIQQWRDTDMIIGYYNGVPQAMSAFQAQATQNVCNGTKIQRYIRFDRVFVDDSMGPSQIRITTLNNVSASWGIKELFLFAAICHQYCTSCYGPSDTECNSCISSMYLSDTTCSTSCLPSFGLNVSGNVCITCDSKCLKCTYSPTNCSQCVVSGPDSSFLVRENSTCLATCPANMFTNTTDRICYACDSTTGFLLINGTNCIYCPILNCTFCSESAGQQICESCSPGYNLSRTDNLCIECNVNDCLFCQIANKCKTCLTGYVVSLNYVCIQCNIQNCSRCQLPNVCVGCLSGRSLYQNMCHVCDIEKCETCDSDNKCISCQEGHSLKENACMQQVPIEKDTEAAAAATALIIGISSSIVGLVLIFVLCCCCRKYRHTIWDKLKGSNKIDYNNYRQETKSDLVQQANSHPKRLQSLKILNVQNSILQVQHMDKITQKDSKDKYQTQHHQRQDAQVETKKKSVRRAKIMRQKFANNLAIVSLSSNTNRGMTHSESQPEDYNKQQANKIQAIKFQQTQEMIPNIRENKNAITQASQYTEQQLMRNEQISQQISHPRTTIIQIQPHKQYTSSRTVQNNKFANTNAANQYDITAGKQSDAIVTRYLSTNLYRQASSQNRVNVNKLKRQKPKIKNFYTSKNIVKNLDKSLEKSPNKSIQKIANRSSEKNQNRSLSPTRNENKKLQKTETDDSLKINKNKQLFLQFLKQQQRDYQIEKLQTEQRKYQNQNIEQIQQKASKQEQAEQKQNSPKQVNEQIQQDQK